MKKPWTKEEEDFIVSQYINKSCEEMALALGRTTKAVQHKFRELKLKRPKAAIGDTINGWQITSIEQQHNGKQYISYAIAKSVLGDGKIGRYKLTQFTKRSVGWPDRRRPDVVLRNKGNGKTNDLYKHRLYSIWTGMKNRCYNTKQINYPNYGGRGIAICQEWLNSFLKFYEWANLNGYQNGLSIDRINNDGNYEPSNCKWETKRKQNSKRRNSINITAFGETKTADEWSLDERCKCSYASLCYRINQGWNPEKALTKPSKTFDNFRRYKALYYFVQKHHPNILQDFTNKQELGV